MTDHIIPAAALNQHIAVLGKTRSGKSSVLRGLIEGLLDEEKPVCIVDPKGDHWGIKLSRDGKRPGYPVVIFGGAHADVPINAHAGAHVAELFATGNRPCLIDLGGWMVGERTRFYIDFASALFRLTKGQRWLVVDEIHNFAPKGKVMDPDSGKALHWTNRLASEGLGKGIAMLFASQRPQKVHNDTLTSAETLIAMRVLHPSDRGAIADWVKGCGDLKLGNQVLDSLSQMARGEGWAWSPEIGFGPKRVKFPLFKTYDSFRPQTAEDTAALKGWATVDLEEVRQKLASVVKEAEANDPAALKRKIADLEKELRAKGTAKMPALEAATRTSRELRQAFEADRAQDRRELVASMIALAADLDKAMQKEIAEGIAEHFRRMVRDIERVGGAKAKTTLKNFPNVAVEHDHIPARPLPEKMRGLKVEKHFAPGVILSNELKRDDVRWSETTGPERRILNAVAWMNSIGVEKPEKVAVAFIAGYSPTSSSFANPCGALKTRGLIAYPMPGAIALTKEGEALAENPGHVTGEELRHRVLERLPGPERKILGVLIGEYPAEVNNEWLADQSGYSVTSSSFANPRGRLRSLGLIEYPQPGAARAADLLFPDR